MNKIKLDGDLLFEAEGEIKIGHLVKVERGAVYNESGYVTQNIYPEESKGKATGMAKDDNDIQMAIADLYELKDEEGSTLFTDQAQWYAVFRVLSFYCGYPEKMTDFVRLINKNGWDEQEPKCMYQSVKVAKNTLPMLSVKVSLWQQHKNVSDKYFKQCIIAEKLMKMLNIIE